VTVVYSPGNRDRRTDTENRLSRNLLAVVAVLGAATYALSFGPVTNDTVGTGWYVRFAALAALCAAFGLLRRQKPLPLVTAVLAAMGFLDALSSVLQAEPGWAMTAIAVVNALQAAAAVAAMLLGPKGVDDTAAPGYEAYVDYYNQSVRNYYNQYAQSPHLQQSQGSGYGEAHGDAQAAPRAQRASQYADYTEFDYTGSRGPAEHEQGSAPAPRRPSGLPSFGQAPTSADHPRYNSGRSAPPSPPS
jgi:hypothetical protein